MSYFILTDGNIDDLQALYYLYRTIKVDGIVIESGVPDINISISNIILFVNILNWNVNLYYGDLSDTNSPDIWKEESLYCNKILRIYTNKLNHDIYDYNCINFNNTIIISLGKATSLLNIIKKFKIYNFYAFLGGEVFDYNQPKNNFITNEINALMDLESYKEVIKYNGNIFTLNDVTDKRINKAKEFTCKFPLLIEIIPKERSKNWRYWDLVMVMYYF